MKKAIAFLVSLAMMMGTAMVAQADSVEVDFSDVANLTIGDINADGLVSADDIVFLTKIFLGKETVIRGDLTDMNYDGSINIVDAVRLKRKLSGALPISVFRTQANELRSQILSTKDTLPSTVTGNIYYFAENGITGAAGTEDHPLAFSDLRNLLLSSGDAVLFKRGDLFRGTIQLKSGVYYGAYGIGDKPKIYESAQNYATASWSDQGNHVYAISGINKDAGNIIFNDGEAVGFKRSSREAVISEYDFYYDPSSKTVYLYLNRAPSSYRSIEIATNVNLLSSAASTDSVIVENLCLKYTGAHAVSIDRDSSNITIRYCEIGYIGGSYLGGVLRYGNAIQFWCGCENVRAEKNWIYQIYDSGITHQGGGEYLAKKLVFNRNLIEYCGMGSFEYWLSYGVDTDGSLLICRGENVNYTNNICLYAGYCWGGEQRPDKCSSHILSDVTCPNIFNGFNITGNYFDLSSAYLLKIGGSFGTFPRMRNNKYAQTSGALFGTYGQNSGLVFEESSEEKILSILGDTSGKIYWY